MRIHSLFALLLAAGCGSSTPADGPLRNLSAASDMAMAPPDFRMPPDLLTECNAPPNTAPAIMIQQIATDAPTPKGGPAPQDGTYFVTRNTVYTGVNGGSGPTGITYSGTNIVSGNTYRFTSYPSDQAAPFHSSGTFSVNATAFSGAQICPNVATLAFVAYDSDGTTLTVYTTPSMSGTFALTFAKQ